MAAVAGKTESRTARFRAGPRHGTRQGPGRRRPCGPSAGEEGKPPVGCVSAGRRQSRSLRQQSHPARFVAGAGNLWRASTHKGSPLFRRRAPAPNTIDPRGLLTARHGAIGQASGDPSPSTEACRSMESRQTRFAEKRPSHLAGPSRGSEMRTPLQKEACAGESRGMREVGPAVGNGRRGEGIRRRQDALREARCLRGAPRLPVEVSTGSVPLQSG